MSAANRLLEKALPPLVAAYLIWTFCDYSLNWAWPELPYWNLPFAMSNGSGFSLWDLAQGMNAFSYDHAPRARFLSYLFEHLTLKLRVRLWDFLPPHPTLSLVWLPAFLSLIPLRRFLDNLGLDRLTVRVCVALYVLSPGFLSCLTVFSHPGKALANAFIITSLWLASRLDANVRAAGRYGQKQSLAYAGLLAVLALGVYSDEAAWFSCVAIPLLFPGLFLTADHAPRKLVCAAYTLPLVLWVGLLSVLRKFLTLRGLTGWDDYYWYQWLGGTQGRDPLAPLMESYLKNTYYVLASHVTFFNGATIDRSPNWAFWGACLLVAVGAAIGRRLLAKDKRLLFDRLLLLLGVYSVFHDRLMWRWPAIISGLKCAYYYGAPFSLFFVLPLGLGLGAGLTRHGARTRAAALVVLGVFLTLFSYNLRSEALHSKRTMLYDYPQTWGMELDARAEKPLTFRKVYDLWKLRDDPQAVNAARPGFAGRDFWIFLELEARDFPRGWRMFSR